MKIASSIEQYFDDEGRPLVNGRVTFYDHDSDTPAEIFYLVGNDYTAAPNPQFTADDGRIPTVFFEASVKDVKVEKLLPDGSYALLDTFEIGFDFPNAANDTVIYGMDALRDLNTEVGIVQVVGYYDKYDCPVRWYVWDPNCDLDADGGVIVESNTGVEGRWILFYDDELLPSSFYGIKPGEDESNLSGFTGYPDFVGTYKIRTPKMPRFLSGTYTTDGSIHTPKTLYFDDGATFPSCDFQCAAAVIPHNSTYVSEFYFTSENVEAHSSWFRTAQQFLTCGANVLVIDKTNYITDYRITLPCSIVSKTLMYTVNQRFPLTYVNNGRLTLSRVNIMGNGVFNQTDKLSFAYMEIHDEWWLTPNNIDWASTVYARSTSLNTLLLANFKSVDAYIAAVKANGETILDLAGRRVTSLSIGTDSITELRNIQCTNLTISKSGGEIVLRDVHAENVYVTCRYLSTYDNCDLSFSTEPNVTACWFYDSRINASTQWYTSKQVIAENCWMGIVFRFASDNETDHAVLDFTECRFQTNVAFYVKRISMKRCVTSNNTIKIYPYKNTDGYHLVGNFENNVFNNNTPIEFTKFDTIDGRYQDDVYECIANWSFIGNTFAGNDEGIRCRYWQNRTGNNYSKTFIKIGQGVNTIVYEGNNGKCPAASMRGIVISSTDSTYTEQQLDEDHSVYKYTGAWRRVMPGISTSEWWSQHTYDNTETLIKWYSWVNSPYDSLTYDVFYQTAWFAYFRAHDDPINNGDFFAMAILTFGDWIRIVQRGDGDHNRGIVAKVV